MIYYGKVVRYVTRTTMEFSIAALGIDRIFVGEVSGNNYQVGDRIVVGKMGGARSEGFAVVGNLTRGLLATDTGLAASIESLATDFTGYKAQHANTHDILDARIEALAVAVTAAGDLTEVLRRIGNTETGLQDAQSRLGAVEGTVGTMGQALAQKLDASTYTAQDIKAKILGFDGDGSDIDADLLDGRHASDFYLKTDAIDANTVNGKSASDFLPATSYTAADIKSKLLTVDGSGSGIDADLLDGKQAAAFALTGDIPRIASGIVNVAGDTSAQFSTANVTFPAGTFTKAPVVTVSIQTAAGGTLKLVARAYTVTKDGCVVLIHTGDGSNQQNAGNIPVSWIAHQG